MFGSLPRIVPSVLLLLVLLCSAGDVAAVDPVLEPQPANLSVRVVNASRGATVPAERVVVRVSGALLTTVAEAADVDGEVTFEDVEIYNFKPYIISAWVDGVGYHARQSGQEFLDGRVAVVHAFDLTDSTEGVAVTGMNVVVRQEEGGFRYELIATLVNEARPQRTVSADALPLRVALPDGLAGVEVEVDDGPEPYPADLRPAGELHGVHTAIPPGEARITIAGVVTDGDELEFEVACNLAVARWSLMTWPGDLRVRSSDLREDRDHDYAGFGRWRGNELAPGEIVEITVTATEPAVTAPVFSDTPVADAPAPEPERRRSRGFPWITVIAAVVLFGLYVVWRVRR